MNSSHYRVAAYVYITAIEIDLKNIINESVGDELIQNVTFFDDDIREKAIYRLNKDIGFIVSDIKVRDVLDYIDFGDTYQIINKSGESLNKVKKDEVKKRTSSFEKLVGIRNCVMHSRPISFTEYSYVFDLANDMKSCVSMIWKKLCETCNEVESNSSFLSGIDIKVDDFDGRSNHNLPLPDFDETGLIGRDALVKKVKDLCYKSNVSVVSVIGEGGIGKTALALKVAYEILDDPAKKFDMVIWVSSKTTQISTSEIKVIKGAISDSIGVITEISRELGGVTKEEDVFDEVLAYLENFKIALFIDNLETILDDKITKLVQSIGEGSKIIFTSRIGLGAYEHPVKLEGIDEKNACMLLRLLSQVRHVPSLSNLPEETLKNFVNRMNRNPSYIKWFVSCVQYGRQPEEILQNSGMFLEFCMSNVYQYLSNDTRYITSILQCASGLREMPEIAYLSGYDALRLQVCINELLTTNMLSRNSKPILGTVKYSYELSELSKKFLSAKYPVNKKIRNDVKDKINKYKSNLDSFHIESKQYSISGIKLRDKKDIFIANKLKEAIRYVNNQKHELAYQILEECRRLAPDYFEVQRIFAFYYQKNGNHEEAINSFKLAIELSPKTPQIYYWYAKFLLDEDDAEEALEILKKANTLDKNSVEITLALTRAYMYQGDYVNSESALSSILITKDISDVNIKTWCYYNIQLLYRKSDYFQQHKMYDACLSELEKMRFFFIKNENVRKNDSVIINYMKKSLVFLPSVCRNSLTSESKRASELINWLSIVQP